MRFKTFYLKETENDIPKILYHGSNFNFSKFDLKFIGKGEGLQKFGFGIYLTDTEELSNFYTTQLKGTQIIYKCRIPSDSRLYEWDSPVDDYLHNKFINYLNENDFEKDAEKLQDEYEQYNEYMDFESYYKILSHLVGSPKKASESFVNFGIDGCMSNDISNRGKIYVIFDASLIKIIDKDILNESEERNYLKEVISPEKPNKVHSKSVIKNAGTNTAHKLRYKEFVTKNGNKVYVTFKDTFDDGIKIDFQVNDSFDDSNLNDVNVLKNVLYVVLREVNKKKYKRIELNPKHRSDLKRNNKHIRFDLFRKLINKNLNDYSEYYVDRSNYGESDHILLVRKQDIKESEERNHGKLLSELKPSLKTVMIFRARDSKGDEFDSKDYVTLSSKFALEHAESNHVYNDEQYIVIRATVPTNQLAEASNPGEWFYIGPKIHGDVVYKSLGPDDYEGKIIDLKFARKLKL